MSIFEHHRFEIWNQVQHPYKHNITDFSYTNNALNGVSNLQGALDYICAVLWPNNKPNVANVAALPAGGNTINDYRVVLDDGDGKAAGYRWEQREGEGAASWHKIYDVDFGAGTYLAQAFENYQDLFVHKYGNDDLDATGAAVTGTYAGQTIFGGKTANKNLTFKANFGDGTGSQTGYIQLDDNTKMLSGAFGFATTTVASTASITALTSATSHIRFSGSTTTTIHGITAGYAGQLITLTSTGASLVLKNQSGSATGSNRIFTPGAIDLVINGQVSVSLIYDSTAGSWVVCNHCSWPLRANDGTSSNVGYGFQSNAGTGMASSGAGVNLDFYANGTLVAEFNTSALSLARNTTIFGDNASASSVTLAAGSSFDNGSVSLTGGTNALTSSSLKLYGQNHASFPNRIEFFFGATSWLVGASSAGLPYWTTTGRMELGTFLGIGATAGVIAQLTIGGTTALTGDRQVSALFNHTSTSAATHATLALIGAYSAVTTAAAAFTAPNRYQFYGDGSLAKGAGSTITRDTVYGGIQANQGTNNAFLSDSTAYTGSYFIFQSGTNPSVFGGAQITSTATVASTATITALSSTTSAVKLSGSTGTSIQGITAGADGQLIRVWSTGANITIANENAGASAANRITTNSGADVVGTAPNSFTLIYDTTASRWILMASAT